MIVSTSGPDRSGDHLLCTTWALNSDWAAIVQVADHSLINVPQPCQLKSAATVSASSGDVPSAFDKRASL